MIFLYKNDSYDISKIQNATTEIKDRIGKFFAVSNKLYPIIIKLRSYMFSVFFSLIMKSLVLGDRPAAMHSVANVRSAIHTQYMSVVLVICCLIRTLYPYSYETR